MTSTIHDFYDNYHFTILPDGKIVVSKKSRSTELKKYDGKCIDITINNEMKKYLKIHNAKFYEKQSN